MVSRDRVTEQAEDVSVLDRLNSGWSVFSHALEERWVMDVGRIIAPSEEIASWSLQVVPPLVSSQSVGVEFLEEFSGQYLSDDALDFIPAWPDVFKENIVSIWILANWVSFKVNVYCACESVGNNEGRACEVVGSRLWMHTAFKVPIARKYCSCYKIICFDCIFNLFRNVATISNACHAPISSSSES